MPQDRNDKRNISGNIIKQPAEDFQVRSANPVTQFDFDDTQPLLGIYVDVNDQLAVSYAPSTGPASAVVNVRILGVDGEVHPLQFTTPSVAGPGLTVTRFQLLEGFLLSCTIQGTGGVGGANWGYAELSLQRAPFGTGNKYMQLWAGWAYFNIAHGYPTSTTQRPTDGAGSISSFGFGPPAAGADIQITVPVSNRWRLVSLRATLTTAVAVANRLVSFTIDDGANVFFESVSNFTQAASIVNTYNAYDSAPYQNVPFNLRTQQPLASNIFLGPGFRINSSTANIQAADQWSAFRILVQGWPEFT